MRGIETQVEELLADHRYSVIRKIGQGSFGKAILVEKGDSQCICKSVDLTAASKEQQQAAIEESRLLSSLRSPHIVRHRESFSDRSTLCIVMDHCEGGDLASRISLKWRRRKFFEEEQVLLWTTHILLALEYIHDLNIVHRDVKPGNLFLTKDGSLQLGDFGVAKALASSADCATAQVGTPFYLSPEVWQGKKYHCASDMWAMGCVLHELCALHVPFEDANIEGLRENICNGPLPILTGLCSEATEELCMAMLNRDSTSRLSARAALQALVLAPYLELEEKVHLGNSAKRFCGPPTKVCNVTDGPATPYREGDKIEYLSQPGLWIATEVIAVRTQGDIRVASNPNHWICKSVQGSTVRLLCIRDSTSNFGCKRAPSPSLVQDRICGPTRQRIAGLCIDKVDKVSEVSALSDRLPPSDELSTQEVVSRLLGQSKENMKRWRTQIDASEVSKCRPRPLKGGPRRQRIAGPCIDKVDKVPEVSTLSPGSIASLWNIVVKQASAFEHTGGGVAPVGPVF